jgi:2-polyprenyl-6-methoxyphenol hydroxylase-like FAD-dependent oxidoreductase
MEHAERADEGMDVIAAGGGPAGLMTASLLAAAAVRAEVRERGSEPARQSRATAIYLRTLEVLTMIDAGDGRRISDVLLAQGRRVPDTHRAGMPDLLDYRGLDTPFPFTLTLPQRCTEHPLPAHLGVRGGRVRSGAEVTAAGQSADKAGVQASGAWHTARYLAGTDGPHSMVRKAAGIGFHGGVPDQVGCVGDVQSAGPVEHARITGTRSPATPMWCRRAAPPPMSMAPMPAMASWPPSRRARQEEPFSLPGLSATLTGVSGTSFGARSLSWLAQTCNTGRPGRRQPGLERADTRTGHPDSHATYRVTVIPAVN